MALLSTILGGVRLAGRVAGKISSVAQKFAGAGGTLGKIAGGVAKVAGAINKVTTNPIGAVVDGVSRVVSNNRVQQTAQQAAPVVQAVAQGAKHLYNSGMADRLTNGNASRAVNAYNRYARPVVDQVRTQYMSGAPPRMFGGGGGYGGPPG